MTTTWAGGVFAVAMGAIATGVEAQQLSPEVARQIDARFAEFANPRQPGCAVGVSRNGAPIFTKGYGGAVLEHGVAIAPSTAFNLGSVSKQFTAFAALVLAQEGALRLDDDIRRHIPELPESASRIRVRDLLHHTSGLRDYAGLARLGGRPIRDPEHPMEEFVALLARQRQLNFTPGTRHEYVHTDYNVLGVAIERVTDKRLGDVLVEKVWRPLGMTSTRLLDEDGAPIAGQALAYVRDGDAVRARFPAGALRGGTDVYSTVEDMLRWNAAFDRPPAGADSVMSTFLSRPTMAGGEMIPYVHGIHHGSYRGLPVVFRGGHGGFFSADHLTFRTASVSIVVLCNTQQADTFRLARDVADVVLADRLAPVASSPDVYSSPASQAELDRLAGAYSSSDSPWLVADVMARPGTLVVQYRHGSPELPLQRLADGSWSLGPARLAFGPDRSGRMQVTITFNQIDPPLVQTREEVARWRPAPGTLEAYTGTFYSDDVATAWQVVRNGEEFLLRRPGRPDAPLVPIRSDLFAGILRDGGQPIGLTFIRDGGRVVGIDVSDVTAYEVVRALRFDRIR
jgi:CubicO group peptidase (beta-lactamase class C family)